MEGDDGRDRDGAQAVDVGPVLEPGGRVLTTETSAESRRDRSKLAAARVYRGAVELLERDGAPYPARWTRVGASPRLAA